ncbi:MAG: hypothetical protein DWQ34_15230 [Planctomycetota bacterium]|nr:MAG: hypothetical protein DWQ29_09010 [Planctomycetota bacterium]REJ91303.1 MAG: hypothetical protein DWQ34_15230 [Planctomycetota bacterium]REK31276.1 MAG: hypothetical protein DWQ41_00005 [Planctomycetota bacterium]REK37306.1 MAG: hypothetical protein DWQ45_07610 [Planctomycetota bacterium]
MRSILAESSACGRPAISDAVWFRCGMTRGREMLADSAERVGYIVIVGRQFAAARRIDVSRSENCRNPASAAQ